MEIFVMIDFTKYNLSQEDVEFILYGALINGQ